MEPTSPLNTMAGYSFTVAPGERCALCDVQPAVEAYRLGATNVTLPVCGACEEHALDHVAALWEFDSVLLRRCGGRGSHEWFLAVDRVLKATVAADQGGPRP